MLRFLYYLYEHWLLKQIQPGPMPRHVGIILDGNRRYGKQQKLNDSRRIYELGARKLDDVLDWCTDLRIGAVTLWVCSTEKAATASTGAAFSIIRFGGRKQSKI